MDGLLGSKPDAGPPPQPPPFRPFQSGGRGMYPFVAMPQPATSSPSSALGYHASADLAKSDAAMAAAAAAGCYAAAAFGFGTHPGSTAPSSAAAASLMASSQFLAAAELAYPLGSCPRLGVVRPEDALADVPRYPWMALAGEDPLYKNPSIGCRTRDNPEPSTRQAFISSKVV